MGWFSAEHPGHEGFIVGYVRATATSSALWRELGYGDESERVLVERLSVACDCGWRSPRFHTPFGVVAQWRPFTMSLLPKSAGALVALVGPELPDWLIDGYDCSLASDAEGPLVILACRACLVRFMFRAGVRMTARQRWDVQTHGTGIHGECP